jgi:hypothetical protein
MTGIGYCPSKYSKLQSYTPGMPYKITDSEFERRKGANPTLTHHNLLECAGFLSFLLPNKIKTDKEDFQK